MVPRLKRGVLDCGAPPLLFIILALSFLTSTAQQAPTLIPHPPLPAIARISPPSPSPSLCLPLPPPFACPLPDVTVAFVATMSAPRVTPRRAARPPLAAFCGGAPVPGALYRPTHAQVLPHGAWGSNAALSLCSAAGRRRAGLVAPVRWSRSLATPNTPRAPVAAPTKTTPTAAIQRPERYSSSDWWRNLVSLPSSVVLRRISSHVAFNVVTATAVVVAHSYTADMKIWHLSPLPHVLLGTALGLLLSYRTSAAYDRFWEARKVLGGMVNETRNIMRMAVTGLRPAAADAVCRLTIAWTFATMHHLQGTDSEDGVAEYLTPEQLVTVKGVTNRPMAVAMLLATAVADGFTEKEDALVNARAGVGAGATTANLLAERQEMEKLVTLLVDYLGMCERIVLTPIPLNYSRHTSRFLSLWTASLTVVLVELQGPFLILDMLFIAWALFGLEEVGHMIEDPLQLTKSSLPFINVCNTIRRDIEQQGLAVLAHRAAKAGVEGAAGPVVSVVEPAKEPAKVV